MIECDYMEKIKVDLDLSEIAIDEATLMMKKRHSSEQTILVVNESMAFIAGKICQKYQFECIVLPKEIMKPNAWALCGNYSGVWSTGA